MTGPLVGAPAADDRDRILATLVLAFAADPVMRWFWPDPYVYRATLPRFVDAVAGRAFELGTAHSLAAARAVALWLPPGIGGDDEAIGELVLESVEPSLLSDLSAFADGVREHHPQYEHWYLPITGVDPILQGTGLGSSLLRHALATCDRDGRPAYLEASTARSRSLYERAGFQQVGVIQAGSSPTVCPMVRYPITSAV